VRRSYPFRQIPAFDAPPFERRRDSECDRWCRGTLPARNPQERGVRNTSLARQRAKAARRRRHGARDCGGQVIRHGTILVSARIAVKSEFMPLAGMRTVRPRAD
jgi:hypothetical protein